MLTLTDQAVDVVRGLTQSPQAPEHAGLRLAPGGEGLELSVVSDPMRTPADLMTLEAADIETAATELETQR